MSDHPIVPVIDIGPWPAGDAVAREAIARAVDDACREVGFMQVVGHGIPDAAIAGLGEAIDWFFALPMEDKQTWRAPRPSINRGYTPPRSERLSYSLGVVSPDDLFEAFNVGAAASDFPALDLDREIYAENIWPDIDGGPTFRTGVEGVDAVGRRCRSPHDGDLRRRARPAGRPLHPVHRPLDRCPAHEPLRRASRASSRAEPDGDGRPHRLRHRHRAVGRPGSRASRSCGPTARGRRCARRPARC